MSQDSPPNLQSSLLSSQVWTWIRRALRIAAAALCFLFAAWMAVYGMPLSALFGASLTAITFTPLRQRVPSYCRWASWLVVPLFIWQVALPEYAVETKRLACIASTAAGMPYPECESVAFRDVDPRETGPVFTTREHLAVSGFNVILAAGGFLTGHPEVAWETLHLQTAPVPDRELLRQTIRERRVVCRSEMAREGSVTEWTSDFFLNTSVFRERAARLAKELRARPTGATAGPIPAGLPMTGTNNNEVYLSGGPVTVRTALALYVSRPTLMARRTGEERMRLTWEGPIRYPGRAAFRFELPTVHGTYQLRLDEAPFCALQMDGWMSPYRQRWTTAVSLEDDRLKPPAVHRSDPIGLEALVRWIQ